MLAFGLVGVQWRPTAAQDSNSASIKIPLSGVNISRGLILTAPLDQGIEIQVTGPADRLQALKRTRLKYELDLTGLGSGIHTIPVSPDRIALPVGISITKLKTPAVTLWIDREIKKELPIVISLEGETGPDFHLTGVSAYPGKALVKGPQNILDDIEHIATKPIELDGASESFKKEITLDIAKSVTVVFPEYPILARIDIAEKTITRTFEDLPLTGRNINLPYHISPPAISLDVKGPANIVNTLKTSQEFAVYMDLKELKPGIYVRRATIVLPVTTLLVGVNPEIFSVTIKEP